MRIYISGPMRGRPYFNRAMFEAVSAKAREIGLTPVSPIDLDLERCPEIFEQPGARFGTWQGDEREYLRLLIHDLQQIVDCDGMLQLDDWHMSKGARLEASFAAHLPRVTVYGLQPEDIRPWRAFPPHVDYSRICLEDWDEVPEFFEVYRP